MEAYIANLLKAKEVKTQADNNIPIIKQQESEVISTPKPSINTANMSMEDYISYMASNDKVTNSDSDSDDEPIAEPVTEPVAEPVTEPVAEPVTEPVVEPVAEPVSESYDETIPKLIFIVPYRNREQHLHFFKEHMKKVLSDMKTQEYKMYFIHQQDEREFNRGAMKNIGYLAIKKMYPNTYKNITIVFNDVDTMPYTKNFLDYNTVHGKVKHFYGYKFALGGIVSIKAGDFEKTKGFPNFWAWGYEDNTLKQRVVNAKLDLDYSQFYPIMDGNILQLKDGLNRIVSRGEFDKYKDGSSDTYADITNLVYNIDETNGFINVTSFNTKTDASTVQTANFSLESGNAPFITGRRRPKFGMMF